MPIKDKITPQLKNAISDNIKKTKESGREHGFFMCIDKEEKLVASRIKCEGGQCGIVANRLLGTCPGKIQGFFHVHPQRSILEKMEGKKFTEDEVRYLVENYRKRKKDMTAQMPSHKDVLTTLMMKCEEYTEGTICTAGDLETDKVECWTSKKDVANFINCSRAKIDNILTRKMGIAPKKWIRPLFDIEIIDLNKDP